MPVVGETISEIFDTGATGESFGATGSWIDGNPVVWDPSFTDRGNGFYSYSYIATTPGHYSWSGKGSLTGNLVINFEVNPLTTSGATVTFLKQREA